MSPEEQRIAIAEACPRAVKKYVSRLAGAGYVSDEVRLDPLTDLNAMHEAEKTLESQDLEWVYIDALIEVTKANDTVFLRSYFLTHATAAQRAEAFLRTLNLWKD